MLYSENKNLYAHFKTHKTYLFSAFSLFFLSLIHPIYINDILFVSLYQYIFACFLCSYVFVCVRDMCLRVCVRHRLAYIATPFCSMCINMRFVFTNNTYQDKKSKFVIWNLYKIRRSVKSCIYSFK